jgi:hypothetical protein
MARELKPAACALLAKAEVRRRSQYCDSCTEHPQTAPNSQAPCTLRHP